jgi:hypothetical protein
MEQPPKPDEQRDDREEEDSQRHVVALQKFVGFVMMVLAWLQLLLAVSSGSETNSVPFLVFFVGIVIFVNGAVNAWYKYIIMAVATIAGLALHAHISAMGTAARWEKGLIVYGTILVVGYFIFAAPKRVRRIRTPNPPP